MSRRILRIFTVFLTLFIILTAAYGGTVSEASSTQSTSSTSQQLNEAVKEKEELEAALKEAQSLVKNLQGSKDSAEKKIRELDSQLSTISAKIEALITELDNLNTQITETQQALEETTELSVRQYESMKLRIQYIYENGNTNCMNAIFASRDFASMLKAMDYVAAMEKYDRDMMQSYLDTIAYQEELMASLEEQKAAVEQMKVEIEAKQAAVKTLKTAKITELSEIEEDLTDAQELEKIYQAEVEAQKEILDQLKKALAAGQGADMVLSDAGFCWPCPGYTRLSSDYGMRESPTAGASTDHKGIDLAAPHGSVILAAESGKVTTAAYSKSAGNYVIISHGTDSNGNTIATVYMHCSSLYVSEGDIVTRGETIAAVGSTGYSTGNHLHFGVMKNGSYVSPWNYVSR